MNTLNSLKLVLFYQKEHKINTQVPTLHWQAKSLMGHLLLVVSYRSTALFLKNDYI